MYINNLINKFGYSEMYEWSELFKFDIIPFGRFVTFDENEPGKIRLANSNDYIIGVTTVNSVCVSDDPEEWNGKYLCNEYGDILLQSKNIVRAEERYDDIEELPYISTIKDTTIVPVINKEYDNQFEYVKRSDRNEWIRVNILGKCIITDNGECEAGKWCTVGNNGIAILSKEKQNDNCYYVISRISQNTILIFFK